MFDTSLPSFIANPYPYFEPLRILDPVYWTPQDCLLISKHANVVEVLRDKRYGRDLVNRTVACYGPEIMEQPLYRRIRLWALETDPPEQTRIRKALMRVMSLERLEAMRPFVELVVDGLIKRAALVGHMDIIEDYAVRIPMTVICELLGIPEDGRKLLFYDGARLGGRLLDLAPLSAAEINAFNARIIEVSGYFDWLLKARYAEPTDDLITALLEEDLSWDEMISNLILLFGAGFETTTHLIGNGILALYRNPDQLQLLREQPSLIVNAVEEILRYDSPVQASIRVALEDTPLADKGDICINLIGSAHRDPEVYVAPDRFDITRENVKPLSFGGGAHHCLGASLARMQAQIAIATLLTRIPEMTINEQVLANPDWRQTFVLRGLNHLPATW